MEAFGTWVVKHRKAILIVAAILLVPSVIGYLGTRINYDMLDYLPDSMDTVKGQQVLKDDFGKGAFSLIVTEGMSDSDVEKLCGKIKNVEHVENVLAYGDIAKAGIPDGIIPDDILGKMKNGDDSLIAVFFDTGTSADGTIVAVNEIRDLANEQVYVSGMSAMVADLKNIAEREEPLYVLLAVACALALLLLLTDSWLAPFVFLFSIGMAIIYNLGSNFFLGEISYITKALAAILQLAVTMDYSIFLWHGYTENRDKYPGDHLRAMAKAISDTLTALISSMLTASAGFLALCFMSYKLGTDLGIVMAKGCFIGFVASVTILPCLILLCDKPLEKTRHRSLIPRADRLANFVTSKYWAFLIAFVVILVPAVFGFFNKPVYYNVSDSLIGEGSSLPADETRFHTANVKLKESFDVGTTEMILCKADMSHPQAKAMIKRIKDVPGVQYVLGYDSFVGGLLPPQMLPDDLLEVFKSGDYQLVLLNSEYAVASDEVNEQIDAINSIVKEYDSDAMLIGEAPACKDLITTTDFDFVVVDIVAIVAILLILLIVFRSASLPILLVATIEFAILVNLGLPYFMHHQMSFIEPVCVSTIQLGSTVNYAILLTTRYRKERCGGLDKREAISTSISKSLPAVVTSGMSFFAATIGVCIYSNIQLISSLVGLMARGAVVSTCSVLLILPAMFMLFDGVILKSSKGFTPETANRFARLKKQGAERESISETQAVQN